MKHKCSIPVILRVAQNPGIKYILTLYQTHRGNIIKLNTLKHTGILTDLPVYIF